jgi:PadR family transcriptional regulator PadR
MSTTDTDRQNLQKGSAEMVVLALVEKRARHGYEIAKLIESQSESQLQFHVASLYPMLYRMERKGLVEGKWVEQAGERRRRYYQLTPLGHETLVSHRRNWREFVAALNRVTGFGHA